MVCKKCDPSQIKHTISNFYILWCIGTSFHLPTLRKYQNLTIQIIVIILIRHSSKTWWFWRYPHFNSCFEWAYMYGSHCLDFLKMKDCGICLAGSLCSVQFVTSNMYRFLVVFHLSQECFECFNILELLQSMQIDKWAVAHGYFHLVIQAFLPTHLKWSSTSRVKLVDQSTQSEDNYQDCW